MNSIVEVTAKVEELEKRMTVVEEMEKSQSVGDVEYLKKENEALRIENSEMKLMLDKNKYRIEHLIRCLEEEEKKEETINKMQYRINHLIRCLNEAEGHSYEKLLLFKV